MSDKGFSRQDASKFTHLLGPKDPVFTIADSTNKETFFEYRRQWEAAARFELETDFPLQLDFELTNTCNLRCVMCPHGLPAAERDEDYRKPTGLDTATFRKLIDEGVSKGLKSVNLNGINEPFLHPEILDCVRYARQKGVLDVMLNTNAHFVTPDRYDAILDAGLTRIMFSLDAATAETYFKVRRSKDFDKIVSQILGFLERKRARGQALPVSRVSFVKTTLNEHELEAFQEFWKDKVDFFAIQELVSYEKNHDVTGLLSSHSLVEPATFRCPQPWQKVFVDASGNARPCCTVFGKEFKVGSVQGNTIEKIWNSPIFRRLRRLHMEGRWKEEPICRRCVEMNASS